MWRKKKQTKLVEQIHSVLGKMPEEEGRLGQCRVCNSQQVNIWKTFDNIKEVFKSHKKRHYLREDIRCPAKGDVNFPLLRWRLARDAKQLPIAVRWTKNYLFGVIILFPQKHMCPSGAPGFRLESTQVQLPPSGRGRAQRQGKGVGGVKKGRFISTH